MKGIGSVVSLYMDTPRILEVNHFIQTPTGRTYQLVTVRRQERGKHKGRWHLSALVVPASAIKEDDVVHPIAWYPR